MLVVFQLKKYVTFSLCFYQTVETFVRVCGLENAEESLEFGLCFHIVICFFPILFPLLNLYNLIARNTDCFLFVNFD